MFRLSCKSRISRVTAAATAAGGRAPGSHRRTVHDCSIFYASGWSLRPRAFSLPPPLSLSLCMPKQRMNRKLNEPRVTHSANLICKSAVLRMDARHICINTFVQLSTHEDGNRNAPQKNNSYLNYNYFRTEICTFLSF